MTFFPPPDNTLKRELSHYINFLDIPLKYQKLLILLLITPVNMADAEPLTNRLRYEVPSYIEGYVAELAPQKYTNYRRRLDFGITISKYFLVKHYPNYRWKSIRGVLPPRVFYGTIPLSEKDLEWKLNFGPYSPTKDLPVSKIIEDINKGLSECRLLAREGALEALITPLLSTYLGSEKLAKSPFC
jgi:hypothetical protein